MQRKIYRILLGVGLLTEATPLWADSSQKAVEIGQKDPTGIAITFISMMVVFVGLALLYVCFKALGKSSVHLSERNRKRALQKEAAPQKTTAVGEIPAEVQVAIGLALYSATQVAHDQEGDLITITHQGGAPTSPWAQKQSYVRPIPLRPIK